MSLRQHWGCGWGSCSVSSRHCAAASRGKASSVLRVPGLRHCPWPRHCWCVPSLRPTDRPRPFRGSLSTSWQKPPVSTFNSNSLKPRRAFHSYQTIFQSQFLHVWDKFKNIAQHVTFFNSPSDLTKRTQRCLHFPEEDAEAPGVCAACLLMDRHRRTGIGTQKSWY